MDLRRDARADGAFAREFARRAVGATDDARAMASSAAAHAFVRDRIAARLRARDDATTTATATTTTTTTTTYERDPVRAIMRDAGAEDSDSDSDSARSSDDGGRERREATATTRGERGVVERWMAKKRDVHERHSGRGTIQVSMAFEIISTKAKGSAGVEARLAELENTATGANAQTHRISQQEYVTRLHRLNEDIANAWLAEDRVNALKLCVKVAKLLGDTKVGKFYPVLFVLVTEVIETVGRLVYDRILRKSEESTSEGGTKALPEDFKASRVRTVAKNTCRNWFYKIATIRDIVPRIYMELALFKCYRFIQDEPPTVQIRRLMKMSRGVADPLAAAYVRMYIAKCALAYGCETEDSAMTLEILKEFMPSYVNVLDETADEDPATAYIFRLGLRRTEYSELMDPAMEWLIECCATNPNPSLLHKVLYMGGETPPVPFLRAVFRSLSPTVVRENALKLVALVGATSTDEDSLEHRDAMADCYRTLVDKFDVIAPNEGDRLAILGDVWRVVQKWTHVEPYLRVAERFLLYVIKYLAQGELETLMKDVARHVHAHLAQAKEREPTKSAELPAEAMRCVERALRVVTDQFRDVDYLVSLKWYVYLGEILGGEAKVKFSAALLKCGSSAGSISDPMCLHTLLEAARTVHDDIDGMSSEESRAEAESLVVDFINNVSFAGDFEAHLNFLVTARSAFANLDMAQEILVYHAISLMTSVYERVGVEHTNKTKAFVNACTAYCQITIPSVRGVNVRLQLFMLTAQAAIVHGLIQQVDGLIRSAVTDAQESGGETAVGGWIDLPTDRAGAEMLDFVRRCSALLVVQPGNLEKGAFLVFRGLMKVVEDFDWEPSSADEVRAYVSLIPMITAMAQETIPFKIDGLQSNDVLFAGEEAYVEEATELAHELIQRATDLAGNESSLADDDGEDDQAETTHKSRAREFARVNLELAEVIAMTCKPSPEMLALAAGVVDRARRLLPPDVVDPVAAYVHRLLDDASMDVDVDAPRARE